MHSQQLFSNGSGSFAAAAAALLQNHHSGGPYVSLPPHPHNHELLIQHMQRAAVAAAAAASHVAASHRRRKARTVFSDQQLHGLERRLKFLSFLSFRHFCWKSLYFNIIQNFKFNEWWVDLLEKSKTVVSTLKPHFIAMHWLLLWKLFYAIIDFHHNFYFITYFKNIITFYQ